MKFDFCFAAYNSSKWLDGCLAALSKVDYDKKEISLYFADNASTDDTCDHLNALIEKYQGVFGNFQLIPMGGNTGFGTASNAAARAGKGDIVIFYNIDTEIFPDALQELEKAISSSDSSFGAFEMRQFPYEHPKYYNPVTMETSWSSGACFALRRPVFELTGGFDESIFMYAEDVELSWRIRASGYKIRYVPSAITMHYAYKTPGEEKPVQLGGSLAGNLVLRYKYGTEADIQEWNKFCDLVMPRIEANEITNRVFNEQMARVKANKEKYRDFYHHKIEGSGFKPVFMELGYEFARSGAFYENVLPTIHPEFTVVIRTFNRPNVLALTLESLRNQTYKNFKVIVVEDGAEPKAESVVKNAASWLNIRYIAANEHWGRSKAGNTGLFAADTEFLCFLDDDDYFFADHFEVMARMIEDHPDCGMFCAGAVSGSCKPLNEDGSEFEFTKMDLLCHKELHHIDFFVDNPIPIQACVFRKELVEKYGGIEESLDALEDWDLWMRLSCHCNIACTDKATSIYKVPAEDTTYKEREEFISSYRKQVYDRMADYRCEISAQEIYARLKGPENEISRINYLEELKKSTKEIAECRTWKASAPLRYISFLFFFILTFPFRCLRLIFRVITQFFDRIVQLLNRAENAVAPRVPNMEKATPEQYSAFIQNSRSSFCWKLIRKLFGKGSIS